jgi:hypothetical protein
MRRIKRRLEAQQPLPAEVRRPPSAADLAACGAERSHRSCLAGATRTRPLRRPKWLWLEQLRGGFGWF